jgi:hypothetical protein
VIGTILMTLKKNEFRHEFRYDDKCLAGSACTFDLEVLDDQTGPFYVYIQFENYYLNHRKTSKSFDN